jgi:hypothetical protein
VNNKKYTSKTILPLGALLMETSKNTLGFLVAEENYLISLKKVILLIIFVDEFYCIFLETKIMG